MIKLEKISCYSKRGQVGRGRAGIWVRHSAASFGNIVTTNVRREADPKEKTDRPYGGAIKKTTRKLEYDRLRQVRQHMMCVWIPNVKCRAVGGPWRSGRPSPMTNHGYLATTVQKHPGQGWE